MRIFKDFFEAERFCEDNERYEGCGCGCGSGTMTSFEIRGEDVYEIQNTVDIDLTEEKYEDKMGFIWINKDNPYM